MRAATEHGAAVVLWGSGIWSEDWTPLGELPVPCEPFTELGTLTYADWTTHTITPEAFGSVVRLCVSHDGLVAPDGELFEFEERPPTLDEWMELHSEIHRLYWKLREARNQASSWKARRQLRRQQLRNRAEYQREREELAKSYPGGLTEFKLHEVDKRLERHRLEAQGERERAERVRRARQFNGAET